MFKPKTTTNHLYLSLSLFLPLILLAGLVVGISMPQRTVLALACDLAGVHILDDIVPLGGTFTFYEDTSDSLRGFYTGYTITNSAAATSGDIWVKLDSFNVYCFMAYPHDKPLISNCCNA